MSDGVIITMVICFTVLMVAWIGGKNERHKELREFNTTYGDENDNR